MLANFTSQEFSELGHVLFPKGNLRTKLSRNITICPKLFPDSYTGHHITYLNNNTEMFDKDSMDHAIIIRNKTQISHFLPHSLI